MSQSYQTSLLDSEGDSSGVDDLSKGHPTLIKKILALLGFSPLIHTFSLSVSASNHRSCQWWKPSSPLLRFPRRSRSWRRGTPGGRRWSGWPRRTTGRARSRRRTAGSQKPSREPSSTRPNATSHGEIYPLSSEET